MGRVMDGNKEKMKLDNTSETLRVLAQEISQNAVEQRRLALGSIEVLLACSDIFCQDLQNALKEEKAMLEGKLGSFCMNRDS